MPLSLETDVDYFTSLTTDHNT